ncbi:MAG: LysR family transcriptional regulator [Gammaproteobacteria bacterium]|nr:LysR family transcriptional regulator [Gammaproteobacteria bacterium]
MKREEIADLVVFVAVAQEQSFTRAAAKLGLSQSALSQIMQRLEQRLGLRLLARTTRSVAPTEIGEQLLGSLAPMFADIDASISSLNKYRDEPAGTFRISAVEHAAKVYLLPKVARLLRDYPDIRIEIVADYGLVDIVADRFDAGVRLGEQVAKDMIALPISPEIVMAVVGSPDYFARFAIPENPKQLIEHRCINLWLPTAGKVNEWRFKKRGKTIQVRVEGSLTLNTIDHIRDAALEGVGLAYLPYDQIEEHLKNGRLVSVLESWMQALPAYHLYYPNRRQSSPAFNLVVDTLRYR